MIGHLADGSTAVYVLALAVGLATALITGLRRSSSSPANSKLPAKPAVGAAILLGLGVILMCLPLGWLLLNGLPDLPGGARSKLALTYGIALALSYGLAYAAEGALGKSPGTPWLLALTVACLVLFVSGFWPADWHQIINGLVPESLRSAVGGHKP